MSRTLKGRFYPVNSQKYAGKTTPIYRSSWELTFMRMCDSRVDIVQWASEPVKIPYQNPITGKYTVYVPDFFIQYVDRKGNKHTEIIEIKPKKETHEKFAKSKRDKIRLAINTFKWRAAAQWCKDRGLTFRVICEDDIFNNPK